MILPADEVNTRLAWVHIDLGQPLTHLGYAVGGSDNTSIDGVPTWAPNYAQIPETVKLRATEWLVAFLNAAPRNGVAARA